MKKRYITPATARRAPLSMAAPLCSSKSWVVGGDDDETVGGQGVKRRGNDQQEEELPPEEVADAWKTNSLW